MYGSGTDPQHDLVASEPAGNPRRIEVREERVALGCQVLGVDPCTQRLLSPLFALRVRARGTETVDGKAARGDALEVQADALEARPWSWW